MDNWKIKQTIDLQEGERPVRVWPNAIMAPGDGKAHTWEITVLNGGAAASLTGATVTAYFNRNNRTKVLATGSVSGNVVSVTFPAEAYAITGPMYGIFRVSASGGTVVTLSVIRFMILDGPYSETVDPGSAIPSIDDLLAEIGAMQTATAAANDAATAANTAASHSVRFDTAQSLTDAQKTQARTNIGAASESDLEDVSGLADENAANIADLQSDVRSTSPLKSVSGAVAVADNAAPWIPDKALCYIEPIQAGSGTPSTTNVRAISGHSGMVAVRVAGRNLFNRATATTGKYIDSAGAAHTGSGWSASDYIPVQPGQSYIMSGVVAYSNIAQFGFYDEAKTFKSSIANTNAAFTVPDGVCYVRLSIHSEMVSAVMFNAGTAALALEAFGDCVVVTPSFDIAGGTVYGGNFDMSTGILTVDRAILTVTSSTTLTLGTHSATGIPYVGVGGVTGMVPNDASVICSKYPRQTDVADQTFHAISSGLYVYDNRFTSVSAAHSYLDGAVFCYKLANPIAYDLSIPGVRLGRGYNMIWCNTGDAEVEYRQDDSLALENITGPEKAGVAALANIASGEFFFIGGQLYKATSAIATGEMITPGSNCTATSIAEQLTWIIAHINS